MKIELLYIDKGLPENLILEILNKKSVFNFSEILRNILSNGQNDFHNEISELIENNNIIDKDLLAKIIMNYIEENTIFLNFPKNELSYQTFREILIKKNIEISKCNYISINNIENFLLKTNNPKFNDELNDEINDKVIKSRESINKYFNKISKYSKEVSQIKIEERFLYEEKLRSFLNNNFT